VRKALLFVIAWQIAVYCCLMNWEHLDSVLALDAWLVTKRSRLVKRGCGTCLLGLLQGQCRSRMSRREEESMSLDGLTSVVSSFEPQLFSACAHVLVHCFVDIVALVFESTAQ